MVIPCIWYADETDVPENGWVHSLDVETAETNWRHDVGDELVSTPRSYPSRVGSSPGGIVSHSGRSPTSSSGPGGE